MTSPPAITRLRNRPFIVAAVVFLFAVAFAALAIWRFEEHLIGQERARASEQAADHARALQAQIEHTLSAAVALAAVVREGNGTVRDFDRTARALMASYPGAAALQLAPGGVIRNIYPLEGNEPAIGHDLFRDAGRNREAFIARETGKLTLAGPFALRQGGIGAVGRLPVLIEDDTGNPTFWGFTTVLLRFPETLRPALLGSLSNLDYEHKLWRLNPNTRLREVITESSAAALDDPVEFAVNVPNATWTLGIAPANGWANPRRITANIALGLLLSVLFATVAKLLFEQKATQEGLEALVAWRTAEVEAREADLNRAQSIALLGSWVLDLASNRIQWSAQALRMVGASEASRPDYEAFLKQVPPDERDEVRNAWKSALEGSSYDIEHRIVVGDSIRWIRQKATTELGPDGTVRRCAGTLQDVTVLRKAQEELRAAEARYRGLVEHSLAGIYISQDGRWAYANPRLAEIFGYDSPEDLMAVDPLVTVPEQDHARVREFRRCVLEGEVPSYHYTRSAIRKDGTTVVVGVTGTLASHEGRPALIGMIQDISEKKRAEEEIQRYILQLESAFMHAVEVAMTLGEMRDPYTAGHQRRVAKIAVAIGARMGLDAHRVEGLRVAGCLHDIGKMIIPSEILSKPGKLSEIEYTMIQGHAQASYDVLKTVDFPWPVAQVALQHHERMDGSGYPQGLKGEAILLEARILAVADVIEAMSSHRPYRAALGIDVALAEIERGRGTRYDASVVDACLYLFREEKFAISA